ncbi:exported hypothetical protein [Magnetospirillum sp. UT-4]|nr:exported hypothetical protein [Magnetospirillum sp. UT-4]
MLAAMLAFGLAWGGAARGEEARPADFAGWKRWLTALMDFERSPETAQALLREAAGLGYGRAEFALGVLAARDGNGREAMDWFIRAAGHRHPIAMLELGCEASQRGDGAAAERWFGTAVETWLALVGPQWHSGSTPEPGDFAVGDDLAARCPEAATARDGFEDRLARLGTAAAWSRYGRAVNGRTFGGPLLGVAAARERALSWLMRAALAGDVSAMVDVGEAALSTPGADVAGAVRLLERAGEAGRPDAYVAIGIAHRNGRLVHPDPMAAERWFGRAEALTYAQAQTAGEAFPATRVGMLFFRLGDGMGENARAMRWFRLSAEAGDAHAADILATASAR